MKKPKFKSGDEVIVHNFDYGKSSPTRAKIIDRNPTADCQYLGLGYIVFYENLERKARWNEKYIRKVTKLDKILK